MASVLQDPQNKVTNAKFGIVPSATILEVASRLSVEQKEFRWGFLSAGNCSMNYGTLTVFSDGTARWVAEVFSTDNDDSWGCRFAFLDIHNLNIWQHGWIYSPTLTRSPMVWVSTNQIFYPAHLFPDLSTVTMEYRC
jgi:hypothetical protein